MDEIIQKNIKEREQEYLDILFKLLKQPSISTQNIGVDDCAVLLKDIMEESGINTKIMETDGSPVVYGELMHPDNEITLLIYGHYDVQPPEPLEAWISPPFEPTIRDGKIYARGVGDNKGQLLAHVLAVRTLLEVHGKVPVNLKFLFEGEEENGSPNFKPFIEKHKEMLQADLVYGSDGPMDASGAPYVHLGCRGMVLVELTATEADRDNHSGNRGNIVPNPAWTLINLLKTMRNSDGRVTIDGFYDDIREPTDYELEVIRNNDFNPEETAKAFGLKELDFEGEEFFRRISLQPTFNINGLSSGYVGDGHKTIIPSAATVRLDIRLVADQDPEDIYQKIKFHVEKHAPHVDVKCDSKIMPSKTPIDLEIVQKVIQTIGRTYDKRPIVFPSTGATGPSYIFTDILNIPKVGVPYANADEDNHAPNENMNVDLFYKGIEASCNVFLDLAK